MTKGDALLNDEGRENVRHRRRPGLQVGDVKANRIALREYFSSRRNRLDIVKTTRTPNGQVLDWIPIESQLRRGQKLATPPSESVPVQMGRGKTRQRPVICELEDP